MTLEPVRMRASLIVEQFLYFGLLFGLYVT
jgi:hypothetical protein